MCIAVSCVVGRCSLWPVHSVSKTLVAFALLHFIYQDQTCLLIQVSFDFQLLHSSTLWWKGHLFMVLVPEGLVSYHRIIQLQLLQYYRLGYRLGLLWYWMVFLEMNRDHSVIFEIAHKYGIFDSLFDYGGCSFFSERFLPTVVDSIVI